MDYFHNLWTHTSTSCFHIFAQPSLCGMFSLWTGLPGPQSSPLKAQLKNYLKSFLSIPLRRIISNPGLPWNLHGLLVSHTYCASWVPSQLMMGIKTPLSYLCWIYICIANWPHVRLCLRECWEEAARLEEEGTCLFLTAAFGFLSASGSGEQKSSNSLPYCSSSWIQFALSLALQN